MKSVMCAAAGGLFAAVLQGQAMAGIIAVNGGPISNPSTPIADGFLSFRNVRPPTGVSISGQVRRNGPVSETRTAGQLVLSGRAEPGSLGVSAISGPEPTVGLAQPGEVAAGFFEGISFARQVPAGTSASNNLSFVPVGRIDGDLSASFIFGSIPTGQVVNGPSHIGAQAFTSTENFGAAIREATSGEGFFFENTAGPFDVAYDVRNVTGEVVAAPIRNPTEVVVIACRVSCRGATSGGVAYTVAPRSSTSRVDITSFGFGMVLTAEVGGELLVEGRAEAMNSLTIEGLLAIDALGNIVPGVFIADSGFDYNLP